MFHINKYLDDEFRPQVLAWLYENNTEAKDSYYLELDIDQYIEDHVDRSKFDDDDDNDLWLCGVTGKQILQSIYSDPDHMVLCPECAIYYELDENPDSKPDNFPRPPAVPLFRMVDYGGSTCDNCGCQTDYETITIYCD